MIFLVCTNIFIFYLPASITPMEKFATDVFKMFLGLNSFNDPTCINVNKIVTLI